MAQSAEQEPTMEEILASIRRIINEDDEGAEEAPVAEASPDAETGDGFDPDDFGDVPQETAAEEPDDSDVLELTDKLDEEGGGTDPMAIADDLMILDREDSELEAEPEPEPVAEAPGPEPEPAPEPAMAESDEDRLVADTTASAAAGAFAALSGSLKVATDNNQTLEGIVRELMKPMLKQWLDDNLPSIVEEKVQAEIERIARSRR